MSDKVFQINLVIFLVASLISRSLRFFLVAWLLHRYGAGMKGFIDRYFERFPGIRTYMDATVEFAK